MFSTPILQIVANTSMPLVLLLVVTTIHPIPIFPLDIKITTHANKHENMEIASSKFLYSNKHRNINIVSSILIINAPRNMKTCNLAPGNVQKLVQAKDMIKAAGHFICITIKNSSICTLVISRSKH